MQTGKGKGREKKQEKKKKGKRRTEVGAPFSLKSLTGSNKYRVVSYEKERKTDAERRNELIVDGIANLPDGLEWTDNQSPTQGCIDTKTKTIN